MNYRPRPPLTTSRAYRLLRAHYGVHLLSAIRQRRAETGLGLRAAMASLTRYFRYVERRA